MMILVGQETITCPFSCQSSVGNFPSWNERYLGEFVPKVWTSKELLFPCSQMSAGVALKSTWLKWCRAANKLKKNRPFWVFLLKTRQTRQADESNFIRMTQFSAIPGTGSVAIDAQLALRSLDSLWYLRPPPTGSAAAASWPTTPCSRPTTTSAPSRSIRLKG